MFDCISNMMACKKKNIYRKQRKNKRGRKKKNNERNENPKP